MAEEKWVSESVDRLQAMRREIERRLAAARAAEVAQKAATAASQGPTVGSAPKNGN